MSMPKELLKKCEDRVTAALNDSLASKYFFVAYISDSNALSLSESLMTINVRMARFLEAADEALDVPP